MTLKTFGIIVGVGFIICFVTLMVTVFLRTYNLVENDTFDILISYSFFPFMLFTFLLIAFIAGSIKGSGYK